MTTVNISGNINSLSIYDSTKSHPMGATNDGDSSDVTGDAMQHGLPEPGTAPATSDGQPASVVPTDSPQSIAQPRNREDKRGGFANFKQAILVLVITLGFSAFLVTMSTTAAVIVAITGLITAVSAAVVRIVRA